MTRNSVAYEPFVYKQLSQQGLTDDDLQTILETTIKTELVNGYADFCKHAFIKNPSRMLSSYLSIDEQCSKFIKTDYKARRPEELPVLVRYVSIDDATKITQKPAKYVDVILYSREQLNKEANAMNMDSRKLPNYDYLIISLKFQDINTETPMEPITHLRNCLIEEGGSGEPLNRNKYLQSVEFWRTHVQVMKS